MAAKILGLDTAVLNEVKQLFKETNVEEIEIEDGTNLYLRVSRKKPEIQTVMTSAAMPMYQQSVAQGATSSLPAKAAEAPKAVISAYDDASKYHKVKSPVIGTIYESPVPGTPTFVKKGDSVSPDTTVCIVEAMKVMNEIKADVRGKIVEIVKPNGAAIKSGDVLFIIEKQ